MADMAQRAPARGLRRNRSYRRLWFGQAVSLLGDEVLDTAIMLWLGLAAGGQPWGPAAVAGVLVARTVPVLLLSPIGGVYADRWDRRRTMLAMDAIRGLLVLGLALLLLAGSGLPLGVRLGGVYAVVTLAATAALFFNPARYGLLATVVADADRERMGSLLAGTTAMAGIVGPPLAAGMLVLADAPWALLVTAAGFAISYRAVKKVRGGSTPGVPAAPGRSPGLWRDLLAGLRFLTGNRVLRTMLLTNTLVMVGVDAIYTLDIFFVLRNLHAPAQVYGLLGAAFGIGSLAGAALAAAFAPRLRAKQVYAYGFLLTGLLLAGYSRMTTTPGALILLFLTGIPVAATSAMIGPLIMRATPEDLVGRVSAIFQQMTRLASLLTAALSAWLAGTLLRDLDVTVAGVHFGTIDTIFLAAGAVIALAGTLAARSLREDPRST
jgi:MFS family permease